jgi:uncharacterized protein
VIDKILERNPNQGARLTYDTVSVHSLYEDHEYLWSRGFTNISPIAVFEDNWTEETLAVASEQYRRIAEAVLDRMRAGDFRRVNFLSKYIGRLATHTRRMRIPCGACAAYIGVSVDGKVYPCQRFAADGLCQFGTLEGITHPEIRREFLRFHSKNLKGCENCPVRDVCAGGCPAVNYLRANELYTPLPAQCAIIRREYEAAVWLYERLKAEQNPLLPKLIQTSRYANRRRSMPVCEPGVAARKR